MATKLLTQESIAEKLTDAILSKTQLSLLVDISPELSSLPDSVRFPIAEDVTRSDDFLNDLSSTSESRIFLRELRILNENLTDTTQRKLDKAAKLLLKYDGQDELSLSGFVDFRAEFDLLQFLKQVRSKLQDSSGVSQSLKLRIGENSVFLETFSLEDTHQITRLFKSAKAVDAFYEIQDDVKQIRKNGAVSRSLFTSFFESTAADPWYLTQPDVNKLVRDLLETGQDLRLLASSFLRYAIESQNFTLLTKVSEIGPVSIASIDLARSLTFFDHDEQETYLKFATYLRDQFHPNFHDDAQESLRKLAAHQKFDILNIFFDDIPETESSTTTSALRAAICHETLHPCQKPHIFGSLERLLRLSFSTPTFDEDSLSSMIGLLKEFVSFRNSNSSISYAKVCVDLGDFLALLESQGIFEKMPTLISTMTKTAALNLDAESFSAFAKYLGNRESFIFPRDSFEFLTTLRNAGWDHLPEAQYEAAFNLFSCLTDAEKASIRSYYELACTTPQGRIALQLFDDSNGEELFSQYLALDETTQELIKTSEELRSLFSSKKPKLHRL